MNRQRKDNNAIMEHRKMTIPSDKDLLTLNELAERLRLHPDTARSLYRRHVIPGIKLGHRTLRFDYADVLRALREAHDPAADTAAR